MRALLTAAFALSLAGIASQSFRSVHASDGLEIGGAVRDFELRDVEGTPRRLPARDEASAIVLCFNGVGCPISKLYAPRLVKLSQRFSEEKVVFFGINANDHDQVPEIRAFATEHGIGFPILKDHEHEVADLLGAERTTEVFVLDREHVLRYRGAVDDQYSLDEHSTGRRKERPERDWLADAIGAVVRGRRPEPDRTAPPGCVIGRRPAARESADLEYHRDVEPIVAAKCQPCHREGQIAPFELTTWDDISGWSGMIREVVENRRMPPWHANPEYGKFANDRSLSDAERQTIIRWVDQGAPRGDPADGPPPQEYSGTWQIGTPDVVFEMPRSFRVPAEGVIRYQYFAVPTSLEEDHWVKAMEVLPGVRGVVHHILVFCIDPAHPREWERETRSGVRGYFAAMVPGERPCVYPDGLGKRLPAGATLVFQVHYTANGKAVEDRSKIGVVFARDPIEHEVKTRSAAEVRLRIPARDPDYEVHAYHRFRKDAMLLSMLPHMHLRGSAFRYTAHYPAQVELSKAPPRRGLDRELAERIEWDDATKTLHWLGALSKEHLEKLAALYPGAEDRARLEELRRNSRSEILLDVPAYDFGWQNTYRLAEPKPMPAGTVIEALARYDNSPSNPALTREQWSSVVRWGEQTWDEMLIGYFDFYEPGESVASAQSDQESDEGDAGRKNE